MTKQQRNELRMKNDNELCILMVGLCMAFALGYIGNVIGLWFGLLAYFLSVGITLFTIYDNRRYQ